MIQKVFFEKRSDGVNLYRTYSDIAVMIQKNGTDEIYSEAIDVEDSSYTYTETDTLIDDEDLTVQDTLTMLGELGVDTGD